MSGLVSGWVSGLVSQWVSQSVGEWVSGWAGRMRWNELGLGLCCGGRVSYHQRPRPHGLDVASAAPPKGTCPSPGLAPQPGHGPIGSH